MMPQGEDMPVMGIHATHRTFKVLSRDVRVCLVLLESLSGFTGIAKEDSRTLRTVIHAAGWIGGQHACHVRFPLIFESV